MGLPNMSISPDAKIKMTMKYSVVRSTIANIVIPRAESARDAINAWWAAVEREHITDPNILCLSRDPEAFDIQDENGDQVEIDDDVEIFLTQLNRTSPEVVTVDVTWDGHDDKRQSFRLTTPAQVHREASRSRLLALWIEHYKTILEHA
jgi:ferredoxin